MIKLKLDDYGNGGSQDLPIKYECLLHATVNTWFQARFKHSSTFFLWFTKYWPHHVYVYDINMDKQQGTCRPGQFFFILSDIFVNFVFNRGSINASSMGSMFNPVHSSIIITIIIQLCVSILLRMTSFVIFEAIFV